MGKGMKIAIGCLIALVVACIIAAVVVFFLGKAGWNVFGGVAKDAIAIQKLDQTYPYTEPSDGAVPEERLLAYIAVCGKAKPAVEQLRAFSKEHEGKQEGSWSDAKEALKITTGITTAIRQGLEEHQMPPREFHFIANAMRQASFEAEGAGEGGSLDEAQRAMKEGMIQNLEGLLASPGLPDDQRVEIQSQIDVLRQELEGAGSADPNVALFRKYAEQLEQVDLEGLEGVAFQGGPTS